MEISQRLYKIADCVLKDANVVADIGTDHGYVPIYLIHNRKTQKCIASDINQGPLERAQKNIKAHRMENKIETRLGNGISTIEPGEADVIIISGMGGMLILDILKKDLSVVKGARQLILQPQLDVNKVREYIHLIGYMISDEHMIYEDGKFYTIIVAEPGRDIPYSEKEYLFGKKLIDSKNPILKKFISHKIEELSKMKHNIESINTTQTQKRLIEIEKEILIYKEVLQCL